MIPPSPSRGRHPLRSAADRSAAWRPMPGWTCWLTFRVMVGRARPGRSATSVTRHVVGEDLVSEAARLQARRSLLTGKRRHEGCPGAGASRARRQADRVAGPAGATPHPPVFGLQPVRPADRVLFPVAGARGAATTSADARPAPAGAAERDLFRRVLRGREDGRRPPADAPPDLSLGGRGIVLLTCLWSGVHFLAR